MFVAIIHFEMKIIYYQNIVSVHFQKNNQIIDELFRQLICENRVEMHNKLFIRMYRVKD